MCGTRLATRWANRPKRWLVVDRRAIMVRCPPNGHKVGPVVHGRKEKRREEAGSTAIFKETSVDPSWFLNNKGPGSISCNPNWQCPYGLSSPKIGLAVGWLL